ncbi:MAG: hypothetical protein ABSE07_08325 [Methanoregula sp.]|jgi:hypothetical protein
MTDQPPQVNVKVNILPFGTTSVSIKSTQGEVQKKSDDRAQYIAPPTTNTELVEFYFDGDNYYVPSTTGGLI